jgi:glycosyltransferase involved in cell wall biosynthesis
MKTLAVICPVYNEEQVIELFYRELKRVLTTLAEYDAQIIFAVDKSQDGTLAILKRIASQDAAVKILALSSRFGHQMSLLAGMDRTDADAVIMMDSDLQHPPDLIPTLIKEFENGYDIVYTLRLNQTGWFKQLFSTLFYRVINHLSSIPINENAADFRLVSRRVVRVFQKDIRERNQFLRGLFSWVGFKSKAISFASTNRAAGKSKYSYVRLIRFAMDGIVSFSKRPLQAAVGLGLLFAAFGFIYAFITVIQYLFYSQLPPGWATLVILLSIFNGTQLVFLGIIGEYIGAIFDEVKGRPHYIVEEEINFEQPPTR